MADLRRRAVIVETKLGQLRLRVTDRGLANLKLNLATADTMQSRSLGTATRLPANLVKQLRAYAAGRAVRFTIPLDLSAGTAFQQAVWQALRLIPYGETRSYAWVARKIGRPTAARAVGAACGANPVLILVPCHRVVARDGSLGGFSSGLPLKRRLLTLEAQ